MDDLETNSRYTGPPARRSRDRASYIVVLLAATLTAAAGMALWSISRPAYLVKRTLPIGPHQISMRIIYPGDWAATERSFGRSSDEDGQSICSVDLKRRLPTGLQKWAEERLYHVSDKDWQLSKINLQLSPISGYKDLDAETVRLKPLISQLVRAGGTFTMNKSICPAGQVLMVDIDFAANTGRSHYHNSIWMVHPPSTPSEQQYEVVVRYTAPARLNDRVNKVADDVLSRIRIVRNTEQR